MPQLSRGEFRYITTVLIKGRDSGMTSHDCFCDNLQLRIETDLYQTPGITNSNPIRGTNVYESLAPFTVGNLRINANVYNIDIQIYV
jgi:hypothetical protein